MNPLEYAKFYATQHHVVKKGQMYGVLPYTHHLETVERVLREFGATDEDLLVAAWLHDIVEDTDVKLRDVEEQFGESVAALVGAVTSEPGADRRTRVALTLPKTRAAGQRAIILKLADRIANVRSGGSMLKRYQKEYGDFRHALYQTNDPRDVQPFDAMYEMWSELDRLMRIQ